MVQAMINISEEANQILNIVKARFNLHDKSKAIEVAVIKYGEELLEPNLRPEYLEKLNKIRKGKYIKFSSVEELRKTTG
jgi:hypothetical protein